MRFRNPRGTAFKKERKVLVRHGHLKVRRQIRVIHPRRAPSKAVKAKAVRIGNVRSHVDVATVGHT